MKVMSENFKNLNPNANFEAKNSKNGLKAFERDLKEIPRKNIFKGLKYQKSIERKLRDRKNIDFRQTFLFLVGFVQILQDLQNSNKKSLKL